METFNSKFKFDSGLFVIKTDKPHYISGDLVTGKVFIRVFRPLRKAIKLDIEIKG